MPILRTRPRRRRATVACRLRWRSLARTSRLCPPPVSVRRQSSRTCSQLDDRLRRITRTRRRSCPTRAGFRLTPEVVEEHASRGSTASCSQAKTRRTPVPACARRACSTRRSDRSGPSRRRCPAGRSVRDDVVREAGDGEARLADAVERPTISGRARQTTTPARRHPGPGDRAPLIPRRDVIELVALISARSSQARAFGVVVDRVDGCAISSMLNSGRKAVFGHPTVVPERFDHGL